MISQISGVLVTREPDRIEILTAAGLGYELHIPLSVFEKLPEPGAPLKLHTHLVVKEDGWQLFGFGSMFEREVFRRILLAKGVGPGLALGMISTLTAERVVRAIRGKDVALLSTVPRIGRKKAEQVILDLADKLHELASEFEHSAEIAGKAPSTADDAARALITLGYTAADSEKAVRAALDAGAHGTSTAELIKRALAFAGGSGRR